MEVLGCEINAGSEAGSSGGSSDLEHGGANIAVSPRTESLDPHSSHAAVRGFANEYMS
jgi:hypothetical protein